MSSTTFNGPWAKNLTEFTNTLSSMPSQYQSAFDVVSDKSIATICNKSYLHVWETESDIDSLLQLTQVIVKLRNMSTYVPQASSNRPAKSVPAGMLIIAEVSAGRDNFARVCDLVKHLTDQKGSPHFNGGIMSFGGIKVVKGVENARTPDASGVYKSKDVEKSARKAVELVNKSISRIFDAGFYPTEETKKLVWHHGPVIHFLNFWINNTNHDLRSRLRGITVHSSMSLTEKKIRSSPAGELNRLQDLQRLETYCKKMGIFAVFMDPASQLINSISLPTYVIYMAQSVYNLLPSSIIRPHLHTAQDELVTYCFRLYAACNKCYNASVVNIVKKHLRASIAKPWAKLCISPASFDKKTCQAMAKDSEIMKVLGLSDAPFKMFTHDSIPAFSRLTLGPAVDLISEHYICAPVSISFAESSSNCTSLRASNPSPFRIWLPKPDQDEQKVTDRVRGVMMAVVDMVHASNVKLACEPVIGTEEKESWKEVQNACTWALNGCKGKLPEGVEEKVGFVYGMLRTGTWSWCCGVQKGAWRSESVETW